MIAVLVIIAMAAVGLAGAAEVQQYPDSGEIIVTVKNPQAGIYADVDVDGSIFSLGFKGENVTGSILPGGINAVFSDKIYFNSSIAYWDSRWANGQNPAVNVTNGMLDVAGIEPGDTLRLVPLPS